MNKITSPLKEGLKEEIVKMVYYRWDRESIVKKIMEKESLDPKEEEKVYSIVLKIEKEVTDFRHRIGRIKP